MREVNDKIKEELINISYNNDYLYSLLYMCYKNEVNVYSCSLEDDKLNKPNISFVLEYKNMDIYRNFIGALEDTKGISINTSYDMKEDVSYNNKKQLIIDFNSNNKDEVLYKLANSFEVKNNVETEKGLALIKMIFRLINLNKKSIEALIEDGIRVSYGFTNKCEKEKGKIYKLLFNKKEIEYDKEPMYKIGKK